MRTHSATTQNSTHFVEENRRIPIGKAEMKPLGFFPYYLFHLVRVNTTLIEGFGVGIMPYFTYMSTKKS